MPDNTPTLTQESRADNDLDLSDEDIILGPGDYENISTTSCNRIAKSKEIMDCVHNLRLAAAIKAIDGNRNRKRVLEKALEDPEFRAFADKLLLALGYLDDQGQFSLDP